MTLYVWHRTRNHRRHQSNEGNGLPAWSVLHLEAHETRSDDAIEVRTVTAKPEDNPVPAPKRPEPPGRHAPHKKVELRRDSLKKSWRAADQGLSSGQRHRPAHCGLDGDKMRVRTVRRNPANQMTLPVSCGLGVMPLAYYSGSLATDPGATRAACPRRDAQRAGYARGKRTLEALTTCLADGIHAGR